MNLGTQKTLEDFPYDIFCNVRIVKQGWNELADHGAKNEAKVALLVPIIGDGQCTQFFDAWLPVVSEEYHEIVMKIGHPINAPCRGSVHRPNSLCDKPHIFVMSTGSEEVLKSLDYKADQRIKIRVLPQDQDEVADDAGSISRTAR